MSRPANFVQRPESNTGDGTPLLTECLFVAGGIVCLLTSCLLRSWHVPMWVDEILTSNLVQDPSMGHLLRALGDQADGVPPLYYFLVKGWARVFSNGELSLRLFSSVAFCAAFTLLWLTLRRAFRFWPAAIGLSLGICTSETIRFENSNARFYGLLFFLITLATVLAVKLGAREHAGVTTILANAASQALLVLCHPLGGLYGAALMIATVLGDRLMYRRIRWAVALSYPFGWSTLLLWLQQLLNQAQVNRPHSWVPVPGLRDFMEANAKTGHFEYLSLSFGLMAAWCLLVHKQMPDQKPADVSVIGTPSDSVAAITCKRLLIAGLSLLGVLPFLWIFSRLVPTNALFVPRYLIGTSIGWLIVMTQLSSLILPWLAGHFSRRFLSAALVVFLLVNLCFLFGKEDLDLNRRGLTGESDSAYGYVDLPIVCASAHDFIPRIHYSFGTSRYYYLLDPHFATMSSYPRPDFLVDYKYVSAVKRNYDDLYQHHIVDVDIFLKDHPAFLVLDVPLISWMPALTNSGEYRITRLDPERPVNIGHDGVLPLLLVERKK